VEFLDGKKQGGGEPQTNEEPAEDINIPFWPFD
jgi:hypothetical protein